MNIFRVLEIATVGWRAAVPPEERLEQLEHVDNWVRRQRELALAQQSARRAGARPPVADVDAWVSQVFPGIHRARERGGE